ncbi:YHS domain protein [Roseivivax jejudonensis]|uniref:YHS domain protein n=1 Tax=Roseivivax jejudonensis TaxID=1529041 RepID=A0A1X6Z4R5_9RHOB|nr:YHS domain-containing (seleno)protein [Roseivivax jejudonensis]SLN40430.1 YHS domain protein [Roseivivax jejudonensis]
MRILILSAALAFAAPAASIAGPQFVDETGFAVSGYDVVAYFDLPQAPVGAPQPAAVPGRASITAEHNGATFAFASEENRDRFLADPEAFVPRYDGHCAYGVAKGGKVPGNPNLWRIVDGALYLNITPNVVGFWEEDIPGNIDTAEGNWVSIEPDAASENTIPQFTSAAPVTQ